MPYDLGLFLKNLGAKCVGLSTVAPLSAPGVILIIAELVQKIRSVIRATNRNLALKAPVASLRSLFEKLQFSSVGKKALTLRAHIETDPVNVDHDKEFQTSRTRSMPLRDGLLRSLVDFSRGQALRQLLEREKLVNLFVVQPNAATDSTLVHFNRAKLQLIHGIPTTRAVHKFRFEPELENSYLSGCDLTVGV